MLWSQYQDKEQQTETRLSTEHNSYKQLITWILEQDLQYSERCLQCNIIKWMISVPKTSMIRRQWSYVYAIWGSTLPTTSCKKTKGD